MDFSTAESTYIDAINFKEIKRRRLNGLSRGYKFELGTLKDLSGPIVYLMSVSNTIVYVGFSRHGLSRPFLGSHQVPILRELNVTLEVIPFEEVEQARIAERQLIKQFTPKYNKRWMPKV